MSRVRYGSRFLKNRPAVTGSRDAFSQTKTLVQLTSSGGPRILAQLRCDSHAKPPPVDPATRPLGRVWRRAPLVRRTIRIRGVRLGYVARSDRTNHEAAV